MGGFRGWDYFSYRLNQSHWWHVHTSPNATGTYTCIVQIGAPFCMAHRQYPSLLSLVVLLVTKITLFYKLIHDLMLILLSFVLYPI